MKDCLTIFLLDAYRLKNWFRTHSFMKLLVFVGFLLITLSIALIELFFSYTFFSFVNRQDEFGDAVVTYSLNSAMLILFFSSLASSIAAISSGLMKPGFLRSVFSAPVKSVDIFVSRFISTFIPSTLLVLILISPIFISYGAVKNLTFDYFFRCLLVLAIFSFSTHLLGCLVALFLTSVRFKASAFLSKFTVILSFSFSLLFIRFLFPGEFFKLYNAQDWISFQTQLGKLPLLSSNLPSNWLASTITQGWSVYTGLAIVGTLFLAVVVFLAGKALYLKAWINQNQVNLLASANSHNKLKPTLFPKIFSSTISPLVLNEILAVFRSQGEINYLAYLLGLATVLTLLAGHIPGLQLSNPDYLPFVQSMLLVGFSYLSMTVSARYAYPLIAKERRTSWFLFSIPVKRTKVLLAKAIFSLLMSLPVYIVGIIAGIQAGLSGNTLTAYLVLFGIIVIFVSEVNLFFGAIAPNFTDGDNPEATSTSGSGMAAIIVSLLSIFMAGLLFYLVYIGSLSIFLGLLIALGTILISFIPIWIISLNKLSLYNL